MAYLNLTLDLLQFLLDLLPLEVLQSPQFLPLLALLCFLPLLPHLPSLLPLVILVSDGASDVPWEGDNLRAIEQQLRRGASLWSANRTSYRSFHIDAEICNL